jgi:glycosyltransferase involved in cell wall biosynthesis
MRAGPRLSQGACPVGPVTKVVIQHFGPDPNTVGGMASVIRVLTEQRLGGEVVDCHPTWSPRSHLTTSRLFAGSARVLLCVPREQIAHIHLSERGSFLREGSLVALADMRGVVTVVTIHGADFLLFAQRLPRLARAVLGRADLITCMDREVLAFVRSNVRGVRCEIVPNPVVVDDGFQPANETDELVVFAGEIGMRKGADVLHQAWEIVARRRPDARCVMVGPLADFLPPRSDRLEVRAPVGPLEMRELLRGARVIALPSRAEGMPMVLTEAMSLGRPFVSTPVGAIPELAAEGGMLADVGDTVGLAEHLTELLSDPELARSIGERGRRFCVRTRSAEVLDARWRELYAEARKARRNR